MGEREIDFLTMDGKPDPAPFRLWFVDRREAGKPINKGDAWEMLPTAVAGEIARLLQDGSDGRLRIGERPVAPGDIAVLVRAHRQARLVQQALRQRGIPSVLCSAGNLFESDEAGEILRFLKAVAERLLGFQSYYEQIARPFEWKFTRTDLQQLVTKLNAQPTCAMAA